MDYKKEYSRWLENVEENDLLEEMNSVHRDLMEEIETKKDIDEELMEKLTSTITVFTTRFKLIE